MVRTFGCPSCGGPLEYKGGGEMIVRCSFCNNSIVVPDELRAPEPLIHRWPAARSSGAHKFYLIFVAVALALGLGAAFFVSRSSRPATLPQQAANIPAPAPPKPTDRKSVV